MRIKINGAEWFEISATVFMYGSFFLSAEQRENNVLVSYSEAADGSTGQTNEKEYVGYAISNCITSISEHDFDVRYNEEEDEYYSEYPEIDSSEWYCAFGNGDETIFVVNGSSPDDPDLVTILDIIIKNFPVAQAAKAFLKN